MSFVSSTQTYMAPGKSMPRDSISSNIIIPQIPGHTEPVVKTSKRQYLLPSPLPKIENKIDPESFKKFVINILTSRGGLKQKEAEYYTQNMTLFVRSMTHDSVNPTDLTDNYEILEHLGDETVNKTATWYLKNRFPQVVKRGDPGVKILSSQRAMLKSKEKLALYSELLGFPKFIQYRKLQFEYIKESGEVKLSKNKTRELKTVVMDRSMKEDALEAFFAAIEESIDNIEGMIGIGYAVAYKILCSVFDTQEISIYPYDLIDPKTQLKEIFDKRRSWGDSEIYSRATPENPEITLTLTLKVPPPGKISVVKEPITKVFKAETLVRTGIDEEEYETNTTQLHLKLARTALEWLHKKYNYAPEFIRYYPGQE